MIVFSRNLSGLIFLFFRIHTVLLAKQKSNIVMKVRFILSFLAALFIAGNMIAIESTDRVERKLPSRADRSCLSVRR